MSFADPKGYRVADSIANLLLMIESSVIGSGKKSGAVAQLGARVNGIHEVAGSIPASSTKSYTLCMVGSRLNCS